MNPGANMDNFCTMFRSGMFSFHWKLSKEGRKRFFDEFLPLLHNTKHEVLGKEEARSWYLVYIGTRPGSRGKGYAKALIENLTQKVYLHSTFIPWEAGRRPATQLPCHASLDKKPS